MFQVLDFVSMRTTNRQVRQGQQEGGWYHIAWGFLKVSILVLINIFINCSSINKKSKLNSLAAFFTSETMSNDGVNISCVI